MKLLEEWNSNNNYNTRVENIRNGLGPFLGGTGINLEKDVTVFNDGDFDKLTGSSGQDWFFFDLGADDVTDKKGNEAEN